MNNPVQQQGTFVISKTVNVFKGANAVISYVHHYLKTNMYGEIIFHFHADNCVAQNKNKYVLEYFW